MVDEPFRLRVLKALTDHLKTAHESLVDDVDEYGRPLPHVFRGRDIFGQNDVLPVISILEAPDEGRRVDAKSPFTIQQNFWRLLIQGFVQDDPENPTDAAYLIAAHAVRSVAKLKRQKYDILGFGDKKPCVVDLEIGAPIVRPADNEVSDVSFFYFPVTLHLVEDLENPFQ